jgi:hypothetical protein
MKKTKSYSKAMFALIVAICFIAFSAFEKQPAGGAQKTTYTINGTSIKGKEVICTIKITYNNTHPLTKENKYVNTAIHEFKDSLSSYSLIEIYSNKRFELENIASSIFYRHLISSNIKMEGATISSITISNNDIANIHRMLIMEQNQIAIKYRQENIEDNIQKQIINTSDTYVIDSLQNELKLLPIKMDSLKNQYQYTIDSIKALY